MSTSLCHDLLKLQGEWSSFVSRGRPQTACVRPDLENLSAVLDRGATRRCHRCGACGLFWARVEQMKAGLDYQDLVALIERAFDPGATVLVSEWIEGPDGSRDCDVLVERLNWMTALRPFTSRLFRTEMPRFMWTAAGCEPAMLSRVAPIPVDPGRHLACARKGVPHGLPGRRAEARERLRDPRLMDGRGVGARPEDERSAFGGGCDDEPEASGKYLFGVGSVLLQKVLKARAVPVVPRRKQPRATAG